MISSLRKKVFWSILLSAAGVLLVILIAFNVLKLAQTSSKVGSILDSAPMLLEEERGTGAPVPQNQGQDPGQNQGRGDRRGERNKSELMRSVSEDELGAVKLNADGSEAVRTGCAEALDDETVAAIVAAALADADGRGRSGQWEYRTVSLSDGTGVLFLNAASLRQENLETALLSLAAFAAACGLFAWMANLLAKAIVKPVEENMQAQKRFVADASHELKTPLTVIDANAAVLEQSVGQSKWLDYIKEQTGRMAGLVNELLQLSHLEEEQEAGAPQKAEPYDAAEAVMEAALPFESVAFEKGVTLETEVPEMLPAVGNGKDLEQLAAILIDNAVKHSPEGGTVKVTLGKASAGHGRKEGQMLELRVANSGEEIPAEALPHIFDRFYRVDASRTSDGGRGGSYGLGLAIAKGIIEKHGGSISVTSQDGLTEFTVSLPGARAE